MDTSGPVERLAPYGAAAIIAVSVATALPPFLVGASAVSLQRELRIGPGLIGIAVTVYFAATSVMSPVLSHVVQRIGARRGTIVASFGAATALLGLASLRSVPHLLVLLALAGSANAVAHPAVNTLLFRRIPSRRRGLAFGTKQASAPLSSLLGGLAIPTIALRFGWRWTFIVAAAFAVAVGTTARSGAAEQAETRVRQAGRFEDLRRASNRRGAGLALPMFAIASGFGAAAGNGVGIFIVDAGVQSAGLTEGLSALIYASASIVGVVARVGMGAVVDASPSGIRVPLTIMMTLVGAAGFGLLSLETSVAFVLGACLAYGAGWGWSGIIQFTVLDDYPDAPERATGVLLSGFAMGSATGPLLLGQLAERYSYDAVWTAGGLLFLVSTAAMFVAHRLTAPELPSRRRAMP